MIKWQLVMILLVSSFFIVACEDVETPTGQVIKEVDKEPEQSEIQPSETATQTEIVKEEAQAETTKEETQETPTKEKGRLEEIKEGLEKTKDALEGYKEKTDKLDECTRLCADDSYKIPAVKDQCYLTCYEIYYYGGMESLDDLIEDFKK